LAFRAFHFLYPHGKCTDVMSKLSLSINSSFHKSRHSGESRNPVLSRPSGCRIKSGMTEKAIYGQILNNSNNPTAELSTKRNEVQNCHSCPDSHRDKLQQGDRREAE
jgi:hypothetical protein